jgi:hypothetical protein
VCLLTSIGLISLAAFSIVHWIERQLLTTDNYVAMVAPLPKNPEVANAISSYTVTQLFTSTDLSNKIEQALPDKITFLAGPLSEQLQTRLTNRTRQLVQSDRFNTIWVSANTVASQRLLTTARGTNPPREKRVNFSIDMSGLRTRVATFLGKNAPIDTASATQRPQSDLVVNLKTSMQKIHSYIRTVDFLNGTLGLLAVVCLVGAVVLARLRRRLLLVMGVSILVIGLLQLIGIKALRPAVINELQQVAYRPAAGVVYDTLVASFRRTATTAVVVGAGLSALAFLWRRQYVARLKPVERWLRSARGKAATQKVHDFRETVRRYRWYAAGVVVLLGLVLMAFVLNLDWQGVVRTLLFTVLAIEVINLAAARPGGMPMEQ